MLVSSAARYLRTRSSGAIQEMYWCPPATGPPSPSRNVVWCDSFGSEKTNGKVHSTMVFTQSTDGGLTWSPLARIDKSGDAPAFVPSLAVASDGTVGVTYYDFRNNTPAPGLPTDQWFVHCHPSPTSSCSDPANW